MLSCLWRTLLQGYLRILALSVSAFLAVLLVTRFKAVARFAALSGDWGKTALFTAYQFPLILPIAIPLSALIASYLLFQRLSRSSELLAFRACGLSFHTVLAPVIFVSALLSVANFSMCAEIAPFCRRTSKSMLYRETSANPLLLLQRQQLVKVKHAYLNMEVTEPGVSAKDVVLISYNETNKRLTLFTAKQLSTSNDELQGSGVAFFSHLDGHPEEFDPLILENQLLMTTDASIISQFMKKNQPHCNADALPFKMLLLRTQLEEKKIGNSAWIEIFRRCSLSLAVLSFTFLGAALAIENGRVPAKKSFLILLGLTLMVLLSYLTSKELKKMVVSAFFALFIPHLLIWISGSLRLRRISLGETT